MGPQRNSASWRLDGPLAPLDRQLRDCARRQPGCRALIAADYGIGPLVAVAILAELGDCRRFSSSRHAVRYVGLDIITVYASDRRRAPGRLSRQGPQRCAGRCSRPPSARGDAANQTTPTTSRPQNASAATAPASRSRANCSSAATTCCASSARRRCKPHRLRHRAPSPSSPRCAAASSLRLSHERSAVTPGSSMPARSFRFASVAGSCRSCPSSRRLFSPRRDRRGICS